MISPRLTSTTFAIALTLFTITGCQSKQDAAIEQAKKQAAATGQPQQVISIDKNGSTTTTTVQPPVPGQNGQAITTTVTPGNVQQQPPVQTAQNQTPSDPIVQPVPGSQPVTNSQPAPMPQPGGPPVVQQVAPADVHIPAGTPLAIRINEHISVKSNRPGDRFSGEVAESIAGPDNRVIVPRGTPVNGVIVAAHRRGHFKGASILQLRLTSMTLNGQRYPLDTRDLTRTKKGKGKRTAAFIGGGSGLGMLVGGVASGGVGLLVGGLAGGGAGTAISGLTGNRDIEIPSESIVRFRLAEDLVVQPLS